MNFIHFGCWNNGICRDDNINGLSRMMRLLQTRTPDFITVAGDNYYPNKVDGIKTYNKVNFKSGFECLKRISSIKYVLYGNHDIEDTLVVEEGKDPEKCKTLTEQLKEEGIVFFDDDTYLIKNDDITKTLIIMIDTTMYDMENESIDKTCYSKLKIGSKVRDIDSLMMYQEEKVRRIITENNSLKNVIIVGHHPIISGRRKMKGDKEIINLPTLSKLAILFINLSRELEGKKIYYLCADTHYYQESNISINGLSIKQFIVGTGGAELDKTIDKGFYELNKDGIHFTYNILEQIEEYGFLDVSIQADVDGGNIITHFNTANLESSYKIKYLKYKTKYLDLKKLIKK